MRETLTLALKLALKALTTPGIFTKGKYQCHTLEQSERV